MMIFFGFLILLVIFAVPVVAQIDLDGYLKGFIFQNTHSGEFQRLGTRFQTRYSGRWKNRTGIFAAMNFESDWGSLASDSTGERFSIYPVEFYLDYRTNLVDFRFGQQLIFWGVADWVSPTDIINPWNHQRLSGEIEDYRLPVLAANATVYVNDFQLQGVVIPVFDPVETPLPPGTEVVLPEKKFSNSQWGARVTSYLGMADISLTVFDGYEHSPAMMVDKKLRAKYLRYQLIGFDIIQPFGSLALKSEVVYLHRPDRDGTDPFVRNSQIRSLVGLDYNPTDRISINFQGNFDTYLDYDVDEETERLVSLGLAEMFTAERAMNRQTSLILSWQALDFVTVQTIGLYNIEAKDALMMAFASWDIADGFQALFGTIIFEGPQTSMFGRLDKQDKLFLEIKASF